MQNLLKQFPINTKVAIYNRVSTEKTAQMEAIEHQVWESKKLVEEAGLCLVNQYVETESGTSIKNREEYKKMLFDMRQDAFDVLVVKSQDRMMRSQAEWHLLKRAIHTYHKELYFYMEDEIYNPKENGLKHDVQAMLDEYESEKKSEKAVHSHKRRQNTYQGQSCLNITRPVFGWDRHVQMDENGRKKVFFTVNEKEALAIKEVCSLIERGMGFYRIANVMYEKGVMSKPTLGNNPQLPKRMDGNCWKKIILSPLLHGDALLNTYQTDFYTKEKRKVPKSQWILRTQVIPKILTKEYHEYILELLENRKGITREKSTHKNCIWTGKIVCGECGSHYYGRKISRKDGSIYYHFRCGQNLRGGKCPNIGVNSQQLQACISGILRGNYGNEIKRKTGELMNQFQQICLQQEIGNKTVNRGDEKCHNLLDKQRDKLMELYLNGLIDLDEFARLKNKYFIEENGGQRNEIKENEIKENECFIEAIDRNQRNTISQPRRKEIYETALNKEIFQKIVEEDYLSHIDSVEVKSDKTISVRIDGILSVASLNL